MSVGTVVVSDCPYKRLGRYIVKLAPLVALWLMCFALAFELLLEPSFALFLLWRLSCFAMRCLEIFVNLLQDEALCMVNKVIF